MALHTFCRCLGDPESQCQKIGYMLFVAIHIFWYFINEVMRTVQSNGFP